MNGMTYKERLKSLRCAVIIPTYNNASTIAKVIADVKLYATDVIVVNDGSTDKTFEIVKKYAEDPMCGFVFTISAYYHMYDGMLRMKQQEAAGKVPKDLPVFFVAGAADPVGGSGKLVKNVHKQYIDCGIKNVSIKLYENDRHEILNELDKEVVYEDILNFLRGN